MFQRNFQTRVLVIFLVFILLFMLVFFKVFYIQVIDYKKISNLASNLWSRNLPIGADRGLIKDRNGKIIADNITTTSLVIVPNQIKNKDAVARDLSQILNVSKEEMLKHLNKKTSIERVHPEGRNLDYEIANKINDLNYDGVYLLKESKRYYPYQKLLSHVLGYVGIDNQGLSGVEKYYDEYLTGSNGAIKYYSDGLGLRLGNKTVYEPPTSGLDLTLTIDYDIQSVVERELDVAVEKYNPDSAWVIVANPNNGEIYAMSSRPSFDSNNYSLYDETVINRNLAIFNTYEPGSTFKIITLASAIEEGKVNLFTDTYYDSGSISVSGNKIKCWKTGGHGSETFLDVVKNSCNPGFVVLGQRLGKETLMSYVHEFGFGEKTGIDLNGEENGILFKVQNMGPLEQATTSFGQGVSVTALQQVMAVSAAINGGYLYTPRIVKNIGINNKEINLISNTAEYKRKVISEETSKLVRFALENVVAKGTGRNAYIEGYTVGGKTGTAQKVENGSYLTNNYILSFIGFMPADNPEVIVYVAIDNPKGVTQYGGTIAAPIAKRILEGSIDALNISKSKSDVLREYQAWDTKYYEVPLVIGLTKEEARNELGSNFLIEYSGSGDKVLYQSPTYGEYLPKNGIIKLMLE